MFARLLPVAHAAGRPAGQVPIHTAGVALCPRPTWRPPPAKLGCGGFPQGGLKLEVVCWYVQAMTHAALLVFCVGLLFRVAVHRSIHMHLCFNQDVSWGVYARLLLIKFPVRQCRTCHTIIVTVTVTSFCKGPAPSLIRWSSFVACPPTLRTGVWGRSCGCLRASARDVGDSWAVLGSRGVWKGPEKAAHSGSKWLHFFFF